MKNLINNKRERDGKKVVITLGKTSEGYVYLGDTQNERSKIKIPMENLPIRENFNVSDFGASSEILDTKLDKSEKRSVKQESINFEEIKQEVAIEEAPLLYKLTEKNNQQQIVLPTCAQWFKFNEIHEIETKALPEFFCGKYPSKNPEVYKEYRNFIINLYRENVNSNLTATRDACAIMRIHAFLEHWGLINFNVDPNTKQVNPLLPKVFNYKSPVYVDASSFLVKDSQSNFGNKIGDNSVILTDNSGNEIKTLYPINSTTEILFRSVFNKNSLNVLNGMNFLAKNYRPKCDICSNLCALDCSSKNDSILICEVCYENENFPRSLTKADFEMGNFYNLVNPNEKSHNSLKQRLESEKWSTSDTMLLIDSLEKYGENWEEIVKEFGNRKTKQECLLHLIQLPIKDNVAFKLGENLNQAKETKEKESSSKVNALNDVNNPVISQVVFFAKMFEKFAENEKSNNVNNNTEKDYTDHDNLKEVIYKTYSKSIDSSKTKRKSEKKKMEKIMNLLIYLQMKKIEMKLDYFNDFEKLIQYETQQMKSMESQVIQDRIKLAIKKSELANLNEKLKKTEIQLKEDPQSALYTLNANVEVDLPLTTKIDADSKVLDLNH